jgi:divalent metal cation (Fe/Co/Zn/Cd) transporter
MSDDPIDNEIWAEEADDGMIDIVIRNKADAAFHSWRVEAVASLTVEEAEELAESITDLVRSRRRAA